MIWKSIPKIILNVTDYIQRLSINAKPQASDKTEPDLPFDLSRSAFISDLNKGVESILTTHVEDTVLGRDDGLIWQ